MIEIVELSDELVVRHLECSRVDVVYVKSIVTAYDGLCGMFSDGGHDIRLVAPRGREAELDQLVEDLERELATRRDACRGSRI